MVMDCDPHANMDDPNECHVCRNHGGPCSECGGEEPVAPAQLHLADLIVAQQERVSIAAASFYRFLDSMEAFDAAE